MVGLTIAAGLCGDAHALRRCTPAGAKLFVGVLLSCQWVCWSSFGL